MVQPRGFHEVAEFYSFALDMYLAVLQMRGITRPGLVSQTAWFLVSKSLTLWFRTNLWIWK
jgi:hypothetical protein